MLKNSNVFHIDGMGKLLNTLQEEYKAGKFRVVIVLAITNDGKAEIGWSGRMTYLESLGLFEVAKHEIALQAM